MNNQNKNSSYYVAQYNKYNAKDIDDKLFAIVEKVRTGDTCVRIRGDLNKKRNILLFASVTLLAALCIQTPTVSAQITQNEISITNAQNNQCVINEINEINDPPRVK